MIVSAWKGGTLGIRIGVNDRGSYFQSSWTIVDISINGIFSTYKLTNNFWTTCPEIRGGEIKNWLIQNNNATWANGSPPKFTLNPLGGNKFELY